MPAQYGDLSIEWLGYATVRIESPDRVIYVDPGRYGVLDGHRPEDGDVVVVTHGDHYDSAGIERVAGPDATVVACVAIDAEAIDRDVVPLGALDQDLLTVAADDEIEVEGVTIRALPAYNPPDGHVDEHGKPHHERGEGVGYLLTIDGTCVFYPGDSDPIEEYEGLETDVFLAPIGGAFAMDRHQAAECAEAFGAELVIPVHYDTFPALEADAEAFAEDAESRGLTVEVLSADTA